MPENMDIYKDGEQVKKRKVIDPNGEVYYVQEAAYEYRPEPEPERPVPQEKQGKDQIQMICPESGTVLTFDVEESIDGEMVVSLRDPSHTLGPQMTADVMTCQDEPYDPEKHGEAPAELPTEEVCVSGAVKVPYMMKGTGAMGAKTVLPVYVSQKVFDDVLLQLYKALEAGESKVSVDFHRKKHQEYNRQNRELEEEAIRMNEELSQEAIRNYEEEAKNWEEINKQQRADEDALIAATLPDNAEGTSNVVNAVDLPHELNHMVDSPNIDIPDTPNYNEGNTNDPPNFDNTDGGFSL